MKPTYLLILIVLTAVLPACSRSGGESPTAQNDDAHDEAPPTSNRVAVPENVRRNLGITFAKVESRPVASTLRVPGQFELLPDGRREYRTMLAGQVELLARQFDKVEPGTPLYKLKSPQWRELQEKLSEAESTIRQTEARVASIPLLMQAHHRHEEILDTSIKIWQQRVEQLEKSQGMGVTSVDDITQARSTLAAQQADLAEILEKEADLEGQITSAQAEHDAAHARFRLLIATAAMLIDMKDQELAAPYNIDEHLHSGIHKHDEPANRLPAKWRLIDEIEVRASVAGVIQSVELTNGSWASEGSLVLTSIDPTRLRFRALGMQSDLGRLHSGLNANIVPPKGGTIDLQNTMPAALTIGLSADPHERTIELIASPEKLSEWARPGVSAHLEITTAGGQSELAIPLSSVVQDGLSRVFFRRDPADPDKVIRMEADLGIDDGRWVVVQSGVKQGDEIVLDGVYQLMIATSGTVQKSGHFHADGTFHAGEDE